VDARDKRGHDGLPISRTSRRYYGRDVVLAGMLAMFAKKRRSERRRATRSTLGSRAWIRLDGSFAVRPCRVIDLSPTGARLSIEGDITKSFVLLLSLNSAGRKARIKWQRGNQVGIQFL
jgi:PilZ domain